MSFSGQGGVEKMVCNLARGFLQSGLEVDMLLIKSKGAHLAAIPKGARVINLQAPTSLLSLPGLVKYLRQERPAALLAAKDRAGRVALLARRIAGGPDQVLLRLGTHLSQSLQGKTGLQKALRYYPARWLYPWADRIICVSQGVAEDIAAITGLPASKFRVIGNPVLSPKLYDLAAQEPEDTWFKEPGAPRIVAMGRLTRQKGYDVLLKAFAELCRQRAGKLLILGEGPLRPQLQTQIQELELQDKVRLAGFKANPYPYLTQADLFVLSSRFEGSPNALKEALALGTPVVATDCNSGPRQILQNGYYGPLVPVDDSPSLARAMQEVLDFPPDKNWLQQAVAGYTLEASAKAYLQEMGLSNPNAGSLTKAKSREAAC
jgi:glycosyltransferase involved in cell wall biosynthesis